MGLLADRHVIVVGAGVGGAAAALLLAAGGARVTLLERVREPRAVGAGILLQPNGLAVLYGLGLEERLRSVGVRASAVPLRDGRGRPFVTARLPDFGAGLDHALVLRRSDLLAALHDSVRAETRIDARLGARVVAASPDGTVSVREGNADDDPVRTLSADLVVGADGVGSRVREGAELGARVSRTGVAYVRGLSPAAAPPDGVGEAWTPLGIFGVAPVLGGAYFYTSAAAPPLAAALARRDLDRFRTAWRRAYPPSAAVLAPLRRFDELLVNEVVRVDCARFAAGRLVLVGDAAHAMAPNLGQGANSALVDAAVLADELTGRGLLSDALDRYDLRRRPAVRRVQDAADLLARASDPRSAPLRRLRDDVLRLAGRLPPDERPTLRAQQEDPARLLRTVRAIVGGQ